jgi:Spy/CpxP family protein refolding chaperone
MKSKTLILLTLSAVASLATTPLARGQAPDDPMAFHHHGPFDLNRMLTHMLNLTDAQQAQVKTLVAEVQPQLDAIHQQARQSADAVLKQLDAKVRPLLTPVQQKRLDAFATLRETRSPDTKGQ